MTDTIQLSKVWSSTGTATDPGDTLYETGWLAEIPTFQKMNHVLSALDSNMLNQAERGHSSWDAEVTYVAGARCYHAGSMWTATVNWALGVEPLIANDSWSQGTYLGDAPANHTIDYGLMIDDIHHTSDSLTAWNKNDITLRSQLPKLFFWTTGGSDNWVMGNSNGEMVLYNAGATTSPDGSAMTPAAASRLFHEAHPPIQSEVAGTIPDSPANGSFYARRDNNWEIVPGGMADAPSDGSPYVRQDAGWVAAQDGASVGDMIVSASTDVQMAARRYHPCDGLPISRTVTFDLLFGHIGTNFGDGNGGTTFNPPKLDPILKGLKGALGAPLIVPTIGDPVQPGTTVDMARDKVSGDLYWAQAASTNRIHRSIGGVSTWTEVGDFEANVSVSTIQHITYDEFHDRLLVLTVAGFLSTIWVSYDKGLTFTSHLVESLRQIKCIAVDSRNGNLWYVAEEGTSANPDLVKVQYAGAGSVVQAGNFLGGTARAITIDETTSNVWCADDNTVSYLPGGVFSGTGTAWIVAGNYLGGSIIDIALDEAKQILYVQDSAANRRIYDLDIATVSFSTFFDSAADWGWDGLEFDQDAGTLWIARQTNTGSNELWYCLSAAGTEDTKWYIKY